MTRNEKIEQLRVMIEVLELSRTTTMAKFEVFADESQRYDSGALISFCMSNNLAIVTMSKAVIKLMEMQDDE